MASIETLKRRRLEAELAVARAKLKPRHQGRRLIDKVRRKFILATADLLRAELNRRTAAPLLRAQAAQRETGDLFSQIGV